MPGVTVLRTKYNVSGSLRQNYYSITGASGDTLVVGMINVERVDMQAPFTSYSVTPGPNPGMSTIFFTTSGAFTAAPIEVTGN